MQKIIAKRIEELSKEIEIAIDNKERYQKAIRDIDIRVTQLVGGLEELKKLRSQKDKKND